MCSHTHTHTQINTAHTHTLINTAHTHTHIHTHTSLVLISSLRLVNVDPDIDVFVPAD